MLILNREAKERIIENYLNKYITFKTAMKNCQQQLDYMMPSLTCRYDSDGRTAAFYISNDTEQVALDRITSKKALDLIENINLYSVIITSIDNALNDLDERQRKFIQLRYFDGLKMHEIKSIIGVSEEKALYRIRKQVLEKFVISLHNLISLK